MTDETNNKVIIYGPASETPVSLLEFYDSDSNELGSVDSEGTARFESIVLDSSILVGDDEDSASRDNVGTLRYRTDTNNSYCDMCMQTGSDTYDWVNIKTNSW